MVLSTTKAAAYGVNRGFCRSCNGYHQLDNKRAQSACFQLMEQLERRQRIDIFQSGQVRSRQLSTDYLFGEARGKMFGVLIGSDSLGVEQRLYAFSGQYNGIWTVPGWVAPLFNPDHFDLLITEKEQQIKHIGATLQRKNIDEQQKNILKKKRKNISRALMREIHKLYTCCNFRGATSSLLDIFINQGAPPSGTGDCCAPKLLHHAAQKKIKPLSLAEFYWGRQNLSSTRRHGHFYLPCTTKCEPILGYFLCGIDSA